MPDNTRKLVFAPFGSDDGGDDILLFEHGLLFALETAAEYAGGFTYADVHAQTGGPDKRTRAVPAFTDTEARVLAARAECDALVEGQLNAARNAETGALTAMTVALRVFFPRANEWAAPDALTFRAFFPEGRPDTLALDFDLFIALQFRLCVLLLDTLDTNIPPAFTTDALQVTRDWDAYVAFLKAKRMAKTPETKQGWYAQAIGHDPQFYLALLNSGLLLKGAADYHGARQRFSQAVKTTDDPAQLAELHFEMGLCSVSLGDTKTARNFWERALDYGADNPALLVNMAGSYEQEENLAEAVRLNEEAVARFPEHHRAIVNLARLHAMRGQLDRAIPLYERALQLEPEDALRRSILGGCYLAAGQTEDARREFTRAAAIDPDSDPGRFAQQELEKLTPPPGDDDGESGPRKKRWGLF